MRPAFLLVFPGLPCHSCLCLLLTAVLALLFSQHHFMPVASAQSAVTTEDYLGVPLGSLKNASHGISGHVWLANATAIQISNFGIESPQKQELAFAFVSEESVEPVKSLYKVVAGSNGEEMLIPMKKRLESVGVGGGQRLVALVPHGNIADWKRFAVVAGKSHKQLSAVAIDKPAPVPFCCLQQEGGQGVVGDHYSAATGPILVEDSRTLLIQKISLEANKAPDAWIFAGNGEVRQSTGKKAMVVGRDTPNRHCSLRDFYSGDSDLRIRLAQGQNIYSIDYLSLFCYQYDVDFGHISFRMDPKNRVPAYIPEPSSQAAGSAASQEEAPEFLENNDLEGTC